jgi:hypothetical protein
MCRCRYKVFDQHQREVAASNWPSQERALSGKSGADGGLNAFGIQALQS